MKREPTRINAVTYKKAISKNWPHQYHEPRAVVRSCIVRHSSKWRDSILTSPNRLPRSDKIAGSLSLTVLQGCHNGLGGFASMYFMHTEIAEVKNETIKEIPHQWLQAWCVGQGAERLLVAALGPRMCYYHPPTRPYCLSSRLSTRFVLGKWKERQVQNSRVGATRMGTIACRAWSFWFRDVFRTAQWRTRAWVAEWSRVQAEREQVYGRWQGLFQTRTNDDPRKKKKTAWSCTGI